MKISKVIFENFRCFYGTVEIPINDFTVFLGKNDQGKSALLEAIDIFINEGRGVAKVDDEDLNKKAKQERKNVFKIGIVFKEFPDKVVIDATNPTTLKDEYLLNQEEGLEIWKTFKNGKVSETFITCNHPHNDDFLKDLLKKKIKELQDFVEKNGINTPNLDKRKSADLRKAIRDYYMQKDGKLECKKIDIKIDEEGLKEIWPKVQNYLPIYALFHSDRKNLDQDSEIQDPLKLRVEQIFKREEIQKKLEEVAKEIKQETQKFAEATIQKFKSLTNESLPFTIMPNIPEVESLKWKEVYKNIGFITNDDIPLNKRGSGIRRIVLVSSFIAESEGKSKESSHHMIYAIEEPETSLHPDLQMELIEALKNLVESGRHQILLSTHSPAIIRLVETDSVRYVEQVNGDAKVEIFNENVADKIVKNLGLLPSIGKVIICVEGSNDEKFLININQNITELKQIINLKEKIEAGLIAIIPLKGSNLKDWINRYALKNTNAVEFHLYDKDKNVQYQNYVEKVNQRKDGSRALLTQKRAIENYIPKELIEKEFNLVLDNVDNNRWDDEDIPAKIQEKLPNRDEKSIKEQLCGSVAQKIKKNDLERLNAWQEVENWFKYIKEMVDKITQP